MRKFSISMLLVLILLSMLPQPALASPMAEPAAAAPRDWSKLADTNGNLLTSAVVADSAILMDSQTGKVLFEKNADDEHFPASITKIMTCLVALESKKDLSEPVTIGKLPTLEAGAETIDLKTGEKLTLEQLLYGLMLMSGNDAANAIAIDVAGSVDAFVAMMNAKAKEIGMTNTHYMNPNGLDNPNHYTSARDMALLTRAAQAYPMFVKLVSTLNYTMPPTNKHSKARPWKNHNLLIDPASSNLYYYQYATGVKTGYTDTAQSTLVSSAQQGNVKLIAVVMHDGKLPKWTDSITMFEYGFNFFDTLDLTQILSSQTLSAGIKNAAPDDPGHGTLAFAPAPKAGAACITDRKDKIDKLRNDPSQIQHTINLTKDTAPIKKDDVVGTVSFSYAGAAVLTCDLKASRDVNAGSASPQVSPQATSSTKNAAGVALIWVGAFLLLLTVAFFAIRFFNDRRKRHNRLQNRNK